MLSFLGVVMAGYCCCCCCRHRDIEYMHACFLWRTPSRTEWCMRMYTVFIEHMKL